MCPTRHFLYSPLTVASLAVHTRTHTQVTRLLREVKYMLRMKLPVNDMALSIYHQEKTFRSHISSLEMVVSMYNEMATTLTSVERPLVEADLNTIDQNLQAGLLEHNWQSNNIQTYIAELLEMVRAVFGTVKAMKGNLKEVERIMKAAAAKPLIQVRAMMRWQQRLGLSSFLFVFLLRLHEPQKAEPVVFNKARRQIYLFSSPVRFVALPSRLLPDFSLVVRLTRFPLLLPSLSFLLSAQGQARDRQGLQRESRQGRRRAQEGARRRR
jgi:hypothetical protein